MRSAVTSVKSISDRVPAWVSLVAVGIAMLIIFFVIFGGRYTLARYGHLPQQSLATLNHNSFDSAVWYIGSFAALFGLYWLSARLFNVPSLHLWLTVRIGRPLFQASA